MAKLPTPADHPTADVIIYDGECQFCTRQVGRLHRWDGKNRLAFISLHDESVAAHYPDLSHEELMQAMVLIDQRGQRYHGASAVRVIPVGYLDYGDSYRCCISLFLCPYGAQGIIG